MKKFFKFALGGAAIAGTACGVVLFLKKVLGWDIFHKKDDDDDFDDFDDDDIDDIDDDDDDSEDREYVTLDMEEEGASEEVKEDAAESKTEEAEEESKETATAE